MDIHKVGVIGAGTMGQGAAEMMAAMGQEVYLSDQTEAKLDEAWNSLISELDRRIEKWSITPAEKKQILSRIHRAPSKESLSDCDLIIETIIEDLTAKQDLFRAMDAFCPPRTILASNTATLSLTEIAAVTRHPERVIGLHFVFPVQRTDIVEIVRAMKTSDATFRATKAFVDNVLRKRSIQVYESPGFVTTRIISILINEAMHTLAEGIADADDIDSAMRIGYGFHYGPLEMADRFGLDSLLAAMESLFREFGELKYRPSVVLKKLVRAGHMGTKTGQGFFSYSRDGKRI